MLWRALARCEETPWGWPRRRTSASFSRVALRSRDEHEHDPLVADLGVSSSVDDLGVSSVERSAAPYYCLLICCFSAAIFFDGGSCALHINRARARRRARAREAINPIQSWMVGMTAKGASIHRTRRCYVEGRRSLLSRILPQRPAADEAGGTKRTHQTQRR